MPTTYPIKYIFWTTKTRFCQRTFKQGQNFPPAAQFLADLAEKSVQSTSNTAPEYRFSVLLSAEAQEGGEQWSHASIHTDILKGGHGPVIQATGLHVLSVYIVSFYLLMFIFNQCPGSVCFWAFWIRIYLYGSVCFYQHAKIWRKTVISTVLWLLYDF